MVGHLRLCSLKTALFCLEVLPVKEWQIYGLFKLYNKPLGENAILGEATLFSRRSPPVKTSIFAL